MDDNDPLKWLRAKSPQRGRPAELLTSHLLDTLRANGAVEQRIGRIEVVQRVLGHRFWPAAALAGLSHDGGKITEGFQDMVYERTRRWGERHEVLSLGFLPWLIEDPELLVWVATGVATHHRPLTGEGYQDLATLYGPSSLAELTQRLGPIPDPAVPALLDWFRRTGLEHGLPIRDGIEAGHVTTHRLVTQSRDLLNTVLDRWADLVSDEAGLAAVLLQGAVTTADRLSSAHSELVAEQPLGPRFPKRIDEHLTAMGGAIRPHQQAAADRSGDLLLRAPTGSGKTEAALLWAATQVTDLAKTCGGTPRVFYTLPYLSSINTMADRLSDLLESTETVGVSHSRAASYHLARGIEPQDGEAPHDGDGDRAAAAAKAVARAEATRLFRESVRVGTPYQLLRAALAGPTYSGVLLDSVNSVFILDELHAYDPQRLGFVLATARLWKRLGGRVAVLSATLPQRLETVFADTLNVSGATINAGSPSPRKRHRLATRDRHLAEPAALDEIHTRLDREESVLIVANNVAQAIELYQELAPGVLERHGEHSAFLLHSRFRRGHRMEREKQIRRRFGTRSARLPGLLVATQVVEVSLDVDFDVLFTAAAPLEALLQRFGRVNRVATRPPADVIVHQPNWTTRRGSTAEYADGIYEREPVSQGWDILTRASGQTIDEADARIWLDAIYASEWGSTWDEQVRESIDTFTDRFLTFRYPFADRNDLGNGFDELFQGTEAILSTDRDAYEKALHEADGPAGRLLADDYLIPLPAWAGELPRYDKKLRVRVIDGAYDPEYGLTQVTGNFASAYQLGEVL
ncbi:CRISPR-associated helicase Cas3' [Streptomyces carpaticus]|uniref:CRISPR-associated helicase Cas3 n=1 Tax=Streptomyces carpaticus TaxID=285558 RepID=A0ABV4ZHK6_9ACTN